MMRKLKTYWIAIVCLLLFNNPFALQAQSTIPDLEKEIQSLKNSIEEMEFTFQVMLKAVDDLTWYQRLSDVAIVDKHWITGPPALNKQNKTEPGLDNPLKFFCYTFIPQKSDKNTKLPLLILPHGGVHGDLQSKYYYRVIRELVSQGYVVVAPEFRGSTGYGKYFYEQIDYGGLEVDDVHAAKEWAINKYSFIDKKRVGLVGWSHGGLIALLETFKYPKDYSCIYAGVPVSDLIMRMGYLGKSYEDLYSADYHIGKTVFEDIEEYKRRSPVWNVKKLEIPLLIHSTTNDEDVNIIEVEHLIQSLKAEDKKFEYKIFNDAPGGHIFGLIDSQQAIESRIQMYEFLAKYLDPLYPFEKN